MKPPPIPGALPGQRHPAGRAHESLNSGDTYKAASPQGLATENFQNTQPAAASILFASNSAKAPESLLSSSPITSASINSPYAARARFSAAGLNWPSISRRSQSASSAPQKTSLPSTIPMPLRAIVRSSSTSASSGSNWPLKSHTEHSVPCTVHSSPSASITPKLVPCSPPCDLQIASSRGL